MIIEFLEMLAMLLKILLLSTLYSLAIVLTIFLFARLTKSSFLQKVEVYRLTGWLCIQILLMIAMYLYAFSYWRNVGMGENPSLPIGYNQRIYSPDYEWTEFFPDLNKTELNKDELKIDSFIVKDQWLCIKVSHQYSNSPDYDYILHDLKSRTQQMFLNRSNYDAFALANSLPQAHVFSDFITEYKKYLNKRVVWKKWLLP